MFSDIYWVQQKIHQIIAGDRGRLGFLHKLLNTTCTLKRAPTYLDLEKW